MNQDQQPQQAMRCYATGKGFFVRLPISEEPESVEQDLDAEAAE